MLLGDTIAVSCTLAVVGSLVVDWRKRHPVVLVNFGPWVGDIRYSKQIIAGCSSPTFHTAQPRMQLA